MADTEYIHPNNTYIVSSGFSDGQLIRYQYYNSLASALRDAGKGTLIISYDPQEVFTGKDGVDVRFIRDVPKNMSEGKWCKVVHRIEYVDTNIESQVLFNDTGLPISNYIKPYSENIHLFPRSDGNSLFHTNIVTGYDGSIYPVPTLIVFHELTIRATPLSPIVQDSMNSVNVVITDSDYVADSGGTSFPPYIAVSICAHVYFTSAQLEVIRRGFGR